MYSVNRWIAVMALCLLAIQGTTALADSAKARCEIYTDEQSAPVKTVPCIFSQRQGYVTIRRDDKVTHDLSPVGSSPGNFTDQDGRPVYRNSGLGDQGLIFRFPGESVYVYWNTNTAKPDANNPTAPYTTDDYDATTLLRCGIIGDSQVKTCPAGILRMENRQASIVVTSPAGEQFTINFLTEYINATNRSLESKLEGDTWKIIINGKEFYEVPIAAIEGG